MEEIEEIIKRQHSRCANQVTPLIVKALESHSERLLKLEAHMKICNKIDIEPVIQPVIEPIVEPVIQPVIEPVIEPIIEPVIQPIVEPVIEPIVESQLMRELQEKLRANRDESTVLNDELETLDDIVNGIDCDDEDSESVCTEACKEILIEAKTNDVQIGTWKLSEQNCNSCVKTQAKAYRKEKKRVDKERATKQKEIKAKQKEIIKEEQKALQTKLKNLKKGRDENYGIEINRQSEMKKELQKLATDYSSMDKTSTFNINMYI
jgi:hypothetical protein